MCKTQERFNSSINSASASEQLNETPPAVRPLSLKVWKVMGSQHKVGPGTFPPCWHNLTSSLAREWWREFPLINQRCHSQTDASGWKCISWNYKKGFCGLRWCFEHFNARWKIFCFDRQKWFHNTLEKRVINLPFSSQFRNDSPSDPNRVKNAHAF